MLGQHPLAKLLALIRPPDIGGQRPSLAATLPDLAGGLGALLPGNYLPHTYTDDLPSIRILEMQREARAKMQEFLAHGVKSIPLGKI